MLIYSTYYNSIINGESQPNPTQQNQLTAVSNFWLKLETTQ